MSRSIWKGPFLDYFLFSRKNLRNKLNPKIWSRRSTIPSYLIGRTVQVHNGKLFRKILISREKVGYKFGDFSFTRNFSRKSKTKNKK